MKAKAVIYLNKYKPSKSGVYPVSIKITFVRERKYYYIGVSMSVADFSKPKARNKNDVAYMDMKLAQAVTAIEELKEGFSFPLFDKLFLKNRALKDTLEGAFDNYIEAMEEDRVGNKSAYTDAKKSLLKFKPQAKFADIDVSWLRSYEKWMDSEGRSKTTIGMYLRSLRAIFNGAIDDGRISKERYPFGSKKYEIPTGRNTKKALAISDIEKIFNVELMPGSTAEMCRDYWVFLYLCHGLNVADFCRLRKSNINGDVLQFVREKTKRTKREVEPITINLLPKAIEVIKKHGGKSLGKNPYLFPHLSETDDYATADKIIANLVRLINEHMKTLAMQLKINKTITTYYARHSFATILKNSGAPVSMISQMLGHSSIATTQNYLDSFETDQIKKATKALVDFTSLSNSGTL